MTSLSEDLKFHKQERLRIKSEINDLESRIIVAGGRRRNRHEVNDLRRRINSLKGRLNEVSLRIADLEKKIENQNQGGQIQVIPNNPLDTISLKKGEITVTDTIEFDRGSFDIGGEVIETIERTIERKIVYKRGKPVSCDETLTETVTRRRGNDMSNLIIESSIVE